MMLRYACDQALWTISIIAQLVAAMGVGLKWMTMAFRLFLFAVLIFWYFIPHLWWYIFSPSVIRRVSYRSSRQTKQRHMAVFLKKMSLATCSSLEDDVADWGSQRHSKEELNSLKWLMSTVNFPEGCNMLSLGRGPTSSDLVEGISEMNGNAERVGSNAKMAAAAATASTIELDATPAGAGGGGGAREGTDAAPTSRTKRTSECMQRKVVNTFSTTESDEEDDDGRKNLHNRATLDIFLPVPLDSLFRMMEQKRLISLRSGLHCKKFPIAICVSGGAWIIGCHFWSSLVGRLLAARGYIVFCPDYRNFPQTDMEGMVLDVSDAIGWVLRNAERYSGDLENVTLVGQSAGAHLTMMSLLSQAQLHAQVVAGGPKPSNVAYNVPRYNPRRSIHCYIGLSGIYNLRGLVKHFHRRGLYRRVLYEIIGGRANLPRYSLNSYFDRHLSGETGEVLPSNIFDFFPERMFFIHGDMDCSAPLSEPANLAFTMRNAQRERLLEQLTSRGANTPNQRVPPVVVKYILVPGANHTDAIIEECLSASTSHLVEFMCYYSTNDTVQGEGLATSGDICEVDEMQEEDDGQNIPSKHPDGRLYTPASQKTRPLLIRLGSCVCPF